MNKNINITYGMEGEGLKYHVPLFRQDDKRWALEPFGPFTVSFAGCGPTCIAMMLSAFTGKLILPPDIAKKYGKEHTSEYGALWSIFKAAADDYSLNLVQTDASELEPALDCLKEGGLVIASMTPGHFTSAGHFIILKGIAPDGMLYINDPASDNNNKKLWNPSIIFNECKQFFLFNN